MTDTYDDEPEPERDYWGEYKDDLAVGRIYEDGTPCDPEPPDDYADGDDAPASVASDKPRRWRSRPRRRGGYAVRLGPFEITLRRRPTNPCGACQGLGWFHTKGTLDPHPAPPGYDGVALCGCGTAHDRLNDTRRRMRAWDRERRNQPPF